MLYFIYFFRKRERENQDKIYLNMDKTCEVLILSCQGRLGNRTIQPRKIQNSKLKKKKKKNKTKTKTKKKAVGAN